MRRLTLLIGCMFIINWNIVLLPQNNLNRQPIYVSPLPGARNISPSTSIAIGAGTPISPSSLDASLFKVTGSQSGSHRGEVRLSDDGITALFYPSHPFVYGEEVQVTVSSGLQTNYGDVVAGMEFAFSIIDRPFSEFPYPSTDLSYLPTHTPDSGDAFNTSPYVTYPEFDNLMPVQVTIPANNTGAGLLFFSHGLGPSYAPSLFILDESGEPIYLQVEEDSFTVTDFKKQTAGGIPYLTYHVGSFDTGWSNGTFYQMDLSYNIIDTWTIGNGYGADEHEMQLLDNGHALLLSYTPIPFDMSPYGGPADGVVMDIIIQEQDTNKNVVFEWHASDHTTLDNNIIPLDHSPLDYFHTNAIEVDTDGNLLISNRHTSEINKIDRATGDILWHLGGALNQFDFTNDEGFSYQHDIRRLPSGHITLFDNGNTKTPTPYTRVVEYALDEQAMEITRVWQYPDNQDSYAPYMGNIQRLENGNSVIGWGAIPQISEVDSSGNIALQLDMGGLTYRAFRFPWEGLPAEPPRLAADLTEDPNSATLYFAWNGATQIGSYDIYAGESITTTSVITNALKTGFETSVVLNNIDPDICVIQVQPVQSMGAMTPLSNVIYLVNRPHCMAQLPYQLHMPFVRSDPLGSP